MKMESRGNQGNQTTSYHNLSELRHNITFVDTKDNEEVLELRKEHVEYCDQVECSIIRSIPSLANMCLNVLDTPSGRSDQILDSIPGLSHLLSSFRHQRWLRHVRFNWLVKALMRAERFVSNHIKTTFDPLGKRLQLFRRDTRHEDVEMGTRYDPSFLHLPGMLPLPERVDGCDASDWCIAVLAHSISMLLPTTVSSAVSDSNDYQTVLELYVSRVRGCLVKWAPGLVQHCFDIAMMYVWWCRGYIGNALGATLRITELIPTEDMDFDLGKSELSFGCLQKGIYFNELGRMMTQVDQPEMACQFYCKAVECATNDPVSTFDLHSLILRASATDQGLMDQWHAERSVAAWDAVLCEPHVPSAVSHAALVSMLHCHTGACVNLPQQPHAEDRNKAWLIQMESRICRLALKNSNYYFYLSLIRALLGVEKGAINAYDTFSKYYHSNEAVPGTIACFEQNKNKINPWGMFSKWLTDPSLTVETEDKNHAIFCMPLLWRLVLCYPECLQDQKDPGCIFDVCGSTPKLKITNDGFLTGIFMGNLPPTTCLLLDPYTGAVCFPDQDRPIELQEWDNLYEREEGHQPSLPAVNPELPSDLNNQGRINYSHSCGFRADTFIPTPVHLFTNKTTGATCSLLVSNEIVNYNICESHQDDFTFYQRSPGIVHHDAMLLYTQGSIDLKVDLRSVILRAGRDAILKCLGGNFRNCPQALSEVRLILDVCVDHGRQIGPGLVGDFINNKQGRLSGIYRHAVEDWNKELIRQFLPPPQVVRVSNILFVGESTVILSCLYALEPYQSQRDNLLVFVSCHSQETFQDPVVHFSGLFDMSASDSREESQVTSWVIPKQADSWKAPGSKIFFAYDQTVSGSGITSKNDLVVFDAHGVVLMRKRSTDTSEGFHGCRSFTTSSGWHILGCDELKTSLVSFNVQDKTCERYYCPNIESFQVASGAVFVANPSGVVVLDAGRLTPLTVCRVLSQIKDGGVVSKNYDGLLVEREFRFLRVLSQPTQRRVSPKLNSNSLATGASRIFLGLANRVLILKTLPQSVQTSSCDLGSVEVIADVALPGIPTEVCYISQSVGFVVTATVSMERHDLETEILYWFDVSGGFRGVHPLLGCSPHGMLAVPMKDQSRESMRNNNDTPRWHLYLADGFGGICCIRF